MRPYFSVRNLLEAFTYSMADTMIGLYTRNINACIHMVIHPYYTLTIKCPYSLSLYHFAHWSFPLCLLSVYK